MSGERDDGELRDEFRRLRRQDARLARPFSTVRQAARRPPGRSRGHLRQRLAAAALGLALVAGGGALHWLRPRTAELPAAAAIARLTHWRAPTDSLLEVPGDQLMRSVPRFGASPFGGEYLAGNDGKLLRRQRKS